MSNINQIFQEYLNNIIILLQNLVKTVKENTEILITNKHLLLETKEILTKMLNSGPAGLAEMSDTLHQIVGQLQKGVQTFQLNSILNDIKDIMNKLGYPSKEEIKQSEKVEEKALEASEITEEFKSELKIAPKKQTSSNDEHLIRPSSFRQK